jgi:hypothetical protein
MPIIWTMPDGSIQVTRIIQEVLDREKHPNETVTEAVIRLGLRDQARTPSLAGGSLSVLPSAALPANRADRHKWRLMGNQVRVDPAVPDPPIPASIQAIQSATTLEDLKAALLAQIRPGLQP